MAASCSSRARILPNRSSSACSISRKVAFGCCSRHSFIPLTTSSASSCQRASKPSRIAPPCLMYARILSHHQAPSAKLCTAPRQARAIAPRREPCYNPVSREPSWLGRPDDPTTPICDFSEPDHRGRETREGGTLGTHNDNRRGGSPRSRTTGAGGTAHHRAHQRGVASLRDRARSPTFDNSFSLPTRQARPHRAESQL
jgi:hypothetical protein